MAVGRLQWTLKMKPWKVSRPVVSDAHHFDEEQDLDLDQEEKQDPDPHLRE